MLAQVGARGLLVGVRWAASRTTSLLGGTTTTEATAAAAAAAATTTGTWLLGHSRHGVVHFFGVRPHKIFIDRPFEKAGGCGQFFGRLVVGQLVGWSVGRLDWVGWSVGFVRSLARSVDDDLRALRALTHRFLYAHGSIADRPSPFFSLNAILEYRSSRFLQVHV